MLKRLFSASFLFLTFTIVLAHEMIPHHHHDDHICFEHSACNDLDKSSQGSESSHNDDQCCLLSDLALIIPGSVNNEVFAVTDLNENLRDDLHFMCNAWQAIHNIRLSGLLPFRQNPLVFFIISQPELSASGLRAPPLS
jgi:hypothetical protein